MNYEHSDQKPSEEAQLQAQSNIINVSELQHQEDDPSKSNDFSIEFLQQRMKRLRQDQKTELEIVQEQYQKKIQKYDDLIQEKIRS